MTNFFFFFFFEKEESLKRKIRILYLSFSFETSNCPLVSIFFSLSLFFFCGIIKPLLSFPVGLYPFFHCNILCDRVLKIETVFWEVYLFSLLLKYTCARNFIHQVATYRISRSLPLYASPFSPYIYKYISPAKYCSFPINCSKRFFFSLGNSLR